MRRPPLLLTAILALAATTSSALPSERQAQCVRLEARIADLRLKLRLGYSARQGRVYRQKLEALENERRQLCR